MRIHTDHLHRPDLFDALDRAGLWRDVWFDNLRTHRSRSRHHAFEVHLAANEGHDYNGTARRPNMAYADGDPGAKAATYDEWGRWMEQLFALDPDAIIGPYKGLEGFRHYHGTKYVLPGAVPA